MLAGNTCVTQYQALLLDHSRVQCETAISPVDDDVFPDDNLQLLIHDGHEMKDESSMWQPSPPMDTPQHGGLNMKSPHRFMCWIPACQ